MLLVAATNTHYKTQLQIWAVPGSLQECKRKSEGSARLTNFYELDVQVKGLSDLEGSLVWFSFTTNPPFCSCFKIVFFMCTAHLVALFHNLYQNETGLMFYRKC